MKKIKRIISLLLAVVMIALMIPIATVSVSASTGGHSQADAVNWANAQVGKSLDYDGAYGAQCVDLIMFYYQYLGTSSPGGNARDYRSNALPSGWQRINYYNGLSPNPGDICVWGPYQGPAISEFGHVGIVTSGNSSTFNSVEQNVGGQYVQTINNRTTSSVACFIRPDFTVSNNPQGVLDGVSGGEGTVSISGWAFDRDNLNATLEIHVYIGGRSGDSNAEGHGGIIANAGMGDVNAVYGCGDYHGFSATITTNKRGSQSVYVYALNVGSGENVQIGEGMVNITSSGQPQITALYISEKKKDSYRVCVQIDRPADVWEVRVATWTQNDQSDLKWTWASYNGYGTYFVDLLRSDFAQSQSYINHIYVYDYSGNSSFDAIFLNYTPPVISDVVVSQVSTRGMRVSCKVEGETNITRVSFPTWPSVDGNPIWHEATDFENGYFSTYISSSEHDHPQSMTFHIYAYDAFGSEGSWGTGGTQITDEPMEFCSKLYKNNKYVFYNTALSWEDANKWCEDNGGHLVAVKDEDEWNAVSSILKQANGTRCWLGANSKSGEWKWVTGEKVAFDAWDLGQPDNTGEVECYMGTYSSNTNLPERSIINCYNWNDYNSEIKAGFICEFEDYYKNGDANLDGTINIRDVTSIQRFVGEFVQFTDEQLAAADVDGNGIVDINDATYLQMYLAEYDVTLG